MKDILQVKGSIHFEGRVVRIGEILLSVVALDWGSLQMNLCLNPGSAIFATNVFTFPLYSSVSSSIKWVGERTMK